MVTVNELKKYESYMIDLRRDFHKHPEIGFEEFRTSKIISEQLKSFGLEVIENFSKTSVIGILDTKIPGKTIGLRADIDALGMPDYKEVPYKSVNEGACHACGHDGHTAILLGTAKYFSENIDTLNLTGKIKFVFQAAEEGPSPGGAKLLIESGYLDDIDIMIGSHVHPDYECGTILFKRDELFASCDIFNVKIIGQGGHGAYPHLNINPITTATQIINIIPNILSSETDALKSAILSICSIHAGDANNVVPNEITFGGTIRTLDSDLRDYILTKLEKIISSVCDMNNCTYELDLDCLCPILKNDNDITEILKNVAIDTLGEDKVFEFPNLDMGSEDFSYYSNEIPSTYFYFGVRNEEKDCNVTFHHPMFDMDEDSMVVVQSVFINTTIKLLS